MSDVRTLPLKLGPKFIRGDITVKDGSGVVGRYPKCLISASGVYGLQWTPLSPSKHFGKNVTVLAELSIGSNSFRFEVMASVSRELTLRTERMGLRFLFRDKEVQRKVAHFIDQHGHLPTAYSRRYPRIPSQQFISDFNLKGTGTSTMTGLNPNPGRIAYRIGNLSPDGLMLVTIEPGATNIRPGDHVDFVMKGSEKSLGEFEIAVKGKVFRASHEVDPVNQRDQWSLGVQFFRIDERSKRVYFKLLEQILTKIKSLSLSTKAA